METTQNLPSPNIVCCMALLGGARNHANVEIAESVFNKITRRFPNNSHLPSAHVLMSECLRLAGRESDADALHSERIQQKLFKEQGATTVLVGTCSYSICWLTDVCAHERMSDASWTGVGHRRVIFGADTAKAVQEARRNEGACWCVYVFIQCMLVNLYTCS